MKLFTTKLDLQEILAPMNTIVEKLHAFQEQHSLEKTENEAKAAALVARNKVIETEHAMADSIKENVKKLLGHA